MVLETTGDQQVNIKSLVLEDPTTALHPFDKLKKSLFYDFKRRLWNESLTESRTRVDPHPLTKVQLAAIVAESSVDPAQAKKELEYLDKKYGSSFTWSWFITNAGLTPNEQQVNMNKFSESQLWTFLAAALNGYPDIMSDWLYFKNDRFITNRGEVSLYDRVQGLWKRSLKETDGYTTESQLLDIWLRTIVEGSSKTYSDFEKLKYGREEFYDQRLQMWNEGYFFAAINSICVDRRWFSSTQLLAAIVEGLFDLPKARELYFKLKESDLFDTNYQQWFLCKELPWDSIIRKYPTLSQLLDLYIKQQLGLYQKKSISSEQKIFPSIRSF